MNPFEDLHTKSRCWSLSEDGIEITYDADFIEETQATGMFDALKAEISWKRVVMQTAFGPKTVPRMISWHADEGLTYSYSGLTHVWQAWTPTLMDIKARLEARTGVKFNGCLANFYEHERDSVSMHSDDEEDMEKEAPIASVSLGAVREFIVKHKQTKSRHVIPLEHGSLLVMSGATQQVSQHGVPKSKRSCASRINLTFRKTLKQ